jgi:hypothetical protein
MARQGHEFVDSQNVAREKLRKEYTSKKWHGGKGSARRISENSEDYKDGWDRIWGNKNKKSQ